jgi:apolipoprotein D and lipocalin family protein
MKPLALLALLLASAARAEDLPDTANLDLKRYTGTWYELARFETFFERGCVGASATYTLRDDGNLGVVNRCFKETLTGKEESVEGKAWVVDPKVPGKLKVQFFWPFSGDYWVLDVAPDYSWALVGNPAKKSCWVFSRTPQVDDALYASLVEKLKVRGYDVTKLLKIAQKTSP